MLMQFAEALPLGVSFWDANQNLQYRNQLGQKFFNTTDPITTEPVDNNSKTNWHAQIQAVAKTGHPRTFEPTRYICADTSIRTLSIAFHPVKTEHAQNHGALLHSVLLIATDCTREEELEAQLAHSAGLAAVGRLAARVAHELNNPLDGSLRYINLANRAIETGQTEKVGDYLTKSAGGLKRMAEIISDLLEFSRSAPDAGDDRNVNWIVEEAIHMMREAADTNQVIIAACLGDEDRMPSIGGTKLLQVCGNLIRNAIDAMPEGGRLNITSGIVDQSIIVRFEDTGTGLPENAEQLFEAFYTTKNSAMSSGKRPDNNTAQGTGLGLAICREYVQQLGGTITATPSREKGAVFVIEIPLPTTDANESPGLKETQA